MAAGPSVKTPNARYLGYRGEDACAWTWMKRTYGAHWVRASNGEAFAAFGPNPYMHTPWASLTTEAIAAYRQHAEPPEGAYHGTHRIRQS